MVVGRLAKAVMAPAPAKNLRRVIEFIPTAPFGERCETLAPTLSNVNIPSILYVLSIHVREGENLRKRALNMDGQDSQDSFFPF